MSVVKIMYKISHNQMKALDDSIEKWREIAYENGVDYANKNCSLCQFNKMCDNCIVKHETGNKHCEDTPYVVWTKHHENKHCHYYSPRKSECEECTEIAIEEYNFLIDLKSKCEVSKYKSILEPIAMFIRNLIYI